MNNSGIPERYGQQEMIAGIAIILMLLTSGAAVVSVLLGLIG